MRRFNDRFALGGKRPDMIIVAASADPKARVAEAMLDRIIGQQEEAIGIGVIVHAEYALASQVGPCSESEYAGLGIITQDRSPALFDRILETKQQLAVHVRQPLDVELPGLDHAAPGE